MSDNSLLQSVFEGLYNYEPEPGKKTDVEDLADRLSRAIGKKKPWSYQYVNSILKGSLEPSRDFNRAVKIIAGSLDGQSPLQARLNPVPKMVYSVNGLRDGDIILGHTRRCKLESCGIRFVPNHPSREYCCYEHTKKGQRHKS